MNNLSKEQSQVCENILDTMKQCGYRNVFTYFGESENIFVRRIGGFAGTGKTTLIASLRNMIKNEYPKLNVAFITYTGKASTVLREKLEKDNAIYSNDYVGTIHGLVYRPLTVWDSDLKTAIVVGWEKIPKDLISQNIFIIDEASMVSETIWNDVLSFGKSVIAVGDHGQLPPIGEDKFNLMNEPDMCLTEIHRQALNSPIIKLSQYVREKGNIPDNICFEGNTVFKLSWNNSICRDIWNQKVTFDKDLIVLTGFNKTRKNLNTIIRNKLGFGGMVVPSPGENIICLNNNYYTKIMNGQIGKVLWVMPETETLHRITVGINDNLYECMVSNHCFGKEDYSVMFDKELFRKEYKHISTKKRYKYPKIDFFDYGYAISVHKSQGSQWKRVVLFEERTKRWDDEYYKKWLYTAVTRAEEKLFIISDYREDLK